MASQWKRSRAGVVPGVKPAGREGGMIKLCRPWIGLVVLVSISLLAPLPAFSQHQPSEPKEPQYTNTFTEVPGLFDEEALIAEMFRSLLSSSKAEPQRPGIRARKGTGSEGDSARTDSDEPY